MANDKEVFNTLIGNLIVEKRMWINKRLVKISKARWIVNQTYNVFVYLGENTICVEVADKFYELEVNIDSIVELKLHKDRLIIFEDSCTYGLSLASFERIDFGFDKNESFFKVQTFDSCNLLIVKEFSLFDVYSGIYFFETKEKKYFSRLFTPSIILGEMLFGSYKSEISCFDWEGGTQWSLDISEIGYFEHPHENRRDKIRVEQFVGVYEQVLWVYLGNMVFLGIDVGSGKVLYRMDQVTTHVNTDYSSERVGELLTLIWDARWFLDKTAGLIKGLCNHCYIEINLKKPVKESNGLISRLFNKKGPVDIYPNISVRHFYNHIRNLGLTNVAIGSVVIDDDFENMYFTNGEVGRWGIYNTKTYSFDYISEPVPSGDSDSFVRLREIKQSGNKVYVLDQESTLHIYEKE